MRRKVLTPASWKRKTRRGKAPKPYRPIIEPVWLGAKDAPAFGHAEFRNRVPSLTAISNDVPRPTTNNKV